MKCCEKHADKSAMEWQRNQSWDETEFQPREDVFTACCTSSLFLLNQFSLFSFLYQLPYLSISHVCPFPLLPFSPLSLSASTSLTKGEGNPTHLDVMKV